MNNLHPGARWLFRVRAFWSLLFLFIALFMATSSDIIRTRILVWLIGGFVLLILFIEIYARMSYNRWLYEVGHDNVRLERGIIWKKYSNIPYERIQNVDTTRGIIARMFGFSSLHIQTAGYSMPVKGFGGHGHAEGTIPALEPEHAEQIREFVLKKIKGKHSGL